MRATEEYLPVVLFMMLYNVVLLLESVAKNNLSRPFKWLFIMLHYAVDEILECDQSNKSERVLPWFVKD